MSNDRIAAHDLRVLQRFLETIAHIQSDRDAHPANVYGNLLIEYYSDTASLSTDVERAVQNKLLGTWSKDFIQRCNGVVTGDDAAQDLLTELNKRCTDVTAAVIDQVKAMRQMQRDEKSEKGKRDALATIIVWTQLLIAISASILALSVTFFRSTGAAQGGTKDPLLLTASWIFFMVSIVCGCYLIPGVSFEQWGNPNPESRRILIPGMIQWLAFVLAMLAFVLFGIVNIA